ncbi:MAG: GNAT family N-acetyltransferase [Betaproteobacteria bacterium]|nr:GNAT family N-acetyltransferase [Betaproteobacteria bacterium]
MPTTFEPVDVALRDGRTVRLRTMERADEEEILQAFDRLGAEARYMRFMHSVREANIPRLRQVLDSFPEKGLAIAATVPAEDGIDIVASATFVIGPGGDDCEFAISVVDDWAGAGLGRVLMTALVDAARRRGLREMTGFVLAENAPMLRLAGRLGFAVRRDPDDFSQCTCRLDLAGANGA